ncbi:MAG: enoyl-CoA hydratase/isomerase family protein [Calditrichaeota bacterium]|nr:enoyl-CoA hydratase/isomerase family protein [Calditrichota bacterium]MCB9368995.1 enoyl-CoA hydratase/isomerase family protein [Calditrichota bacterium]
MSDLAYLKLERDGYVATVFLNRPKQLNALCMALMDELVATLEELDNDDEIRAIVLTGDQRAFAAGADIMEMADADSTEMLRRDQFAKWDRIRKLKKPLIAAVSGFALGGGCELMMHCDMVIASETAQFGQPEIKIGVMPGAGGTQRLTRTVGKARAMEMVLTGKFIGAKQAEAWGLVNRVVPVEVYLSEAQKLAREISQMSPVAVQLAKEAVLKNYESFLSGGLEFERKNFYLLFNTEDQKEGMKAFIEKRPAKFSGK